MPTIEFVRLLAIDIALVLVLILTARAAFSFRRDRLLVRLGILLFLLEDITRWAIAIATALVSPESLVTLDIIRQWSSFSGAVGAILVCLGVTPILVSGSTPRTESHLSASG